MPFNLLKFSPLPASTPASFRKIPHPGAVTIREKPHAFLILAFCLALIGFSPQSSHAQTAVAPTVGDGLTTATAFQITELGNLVWLGERAAANDTTGKYYTLMNDIDASVTATWNDAGTDTNVLEGFRPIGTFDGVSGTSAFRGVFNGNGRKINGLTINRFSMYYVGLFGHIFDGGKILNLTLNDSVINNGTYSGILAGVIKKSLVKNCRVSGFVSGSLVGGLVAESQFGTIVNCSTTGSVTVNSPSGNVGGLVGNNDSGTVVNCFSSCTVTTGWSIGGLIGSNGGTGSRITNSFATGSVKGGKYVGGLIGANTAGSVTYCYATGLVTGEDTGGLIGSNWGSFVTACYWDKEASACTTSEGGVGVVGKTTAEMKQQASFQPGSGLGKTDWDFTTVWGIDEGNSYPYLQQLQTDVSPYRLRVAIDGAGSVTLNPSGSIVQSPGATVTFIPGTIVTLTATPNAKYRFVGWTGAVTDPTTITTTILMDRHEIVIAHFAFNEYQLAVEAVNGTVTKSPDQTTYTYGTVVTLTATPDARYRFTGWTGPVTDPNSPTTTIFMDTFKSVTAHFELNEFQLTVQAINGSVTKSPDQTTYTSGTVVTLTAQPAPRYRFVKWIGPVADPTTPSTTVLMDTHKNVTASFELNEYRLTLKATNGSITKSPDQTTYTYGTVVTLTAIPDTGYNFSGWTGDVADPTSATSTILMTASKTVTANFMQPYEIRTLAELQALTVDLPGYYRLMNDIDASDTANWNDAGTDTGSREGFRPITFKGIFDGQGHKITGLTINRPDMDAVGLFGYIGAGNEIRNLTLEGGTVTGKNSVGGLAGNIYKSSIQKCSSSAAVKGGALVGGLLGAISYSTAKNVSASGEVTATGDAGGLSGKIESSSRISNAVASGPVRSKGRYLHVGGLAGSVGYSTITGGVARGTVTIEASETDNYVGGLIGENSASEIGSCFATGSVTGKGDSPKSLRVGGLIGSNSGEVTSCSATGTVAGENSSLTVGGLIGSNSSTVCFCTASGEVTGKSVYLDEGGLIGRNSGTVTHCSATGSVMTAISAAKGISLTIGGLVGYNLSSISNSFSNGRVASQMSYSSQQSAGGLVGYNSGPVQLCYATGLVTQEGEYVYTGGLVGQNRSEITNCYATGSVRSGGIIGGLVGYHTNGKIRNSFATGAVPGKSCGLIGDTPGTAVTACYWDMKTSGQTTSAGGAGVVGRTTAEMQRQATFQPDGGAGASDWDFTSVWGIVEGQSYPYLRAFESDSPQFNLNVSVQGNGSVTLDPPGGVYAPGTTVTLTATADAGTHFADWTGTVTERTAVSTTIVLNTHKSVSARFLPGYEIRTLAELQAVATGDLGGYYTLMNDLDASPTATWHDAGTTEGLRQGFRPIGAYSYFPTTTTTPFHGVFEGNGRKITGLTINRPTASGIGLFGSIGTEGEVRNLTLEGGTIKGDSSVGGLAGGNAGLIENCTVSTAVTGSFRDVGGLVGNSGDSTARILNCIATGPVTGSWRYSGGLCGYNSGLVSGCVATGEVVCKQGDYIGGLIGENNGRVTRCSSIGSVTTQWANQVGGLVGHNYSGSVADSYAQGAVTGSENIGGLVGLNEGTSSLTNCFATGGVTGSQSAYTGGLVGKDTTNKVTACYWDVETTGRSKSAGGAGVVGKTTAEMKRQATFQPGGGTGASDWDFSTVWGIIEGQTYPYLRSALSTATFYLGTAVNEGQGTITLDPAGGFYAPGTTVTLTATAAPGYHFAGWTGPVTERTAASTPVYMDAHKIVTARFLRNYEIRTLDELQAIATGDLTGYYTLMNDLDASATATWHDDGTTEGLLQGFRPIGNYPKVYYPDTVSFRGVFDGNGKTITGLTINRPETDCVGLFGIVGEKGVIRNLTLKDVRVMGKDSVGGIAGTNRNTILNCKAIGSVTGNQNVGGVAGTSGHLTDCFAAVTVTGTHSTGGLVGFLSNATILNSTANGSVKGGWTDTGGLVGSNDSGIIASCSATGSVSGDSQNIGGLVGHNGGYRVSRREKIINCFATGPVTGRLDAGGLVGYNNAALIENCFATGVVTAAVSGYSYAGGLVGFNYSGTIRNSFATGSVTGAQYAGGLVGYAYTGSSITHCFAIGQVTDPDDPNHTSGLMGNCQSTAITACYWDKETTGQTTSIGSDTRFGKTTAEMKTQTTFQPGGGTGADDWDFTSVWGIAEGQSYPYLRFMPPPFRLNVAVQGEGAFTLDPAGAVVPPPGAGVTYAPATVVTLRDSVPGTSHHFAEWVGAFTNPKTSVTTVLMDTHRSVTAVFAPDECTLTLGPTVHGTILKSPDQATYPYGSLVTLTPQPDPGYCFAGWTGDLPPASKPWQVPLMIKIRRDTTLSARFELIRHTGVWMVR
jgi:uncharacterized repeat protein (TIGR02543 family)